MGLTLPLPAMTPSLYPGERSLSIDNIPLVVHEQQGSSALPLVVFLPGAVHMARIAYGHPDARTTDFLAHWFNEAGYPFAAISYPLDVRQQTFTEVDPDLGLAQYARVVATYIRTLVDEWGLGPGVVVAGWSAAGNIAPGLNVALRDVGIDLELFVALAATPPLPNLIFGSLSATERYFASDHAFTDDGLLSHAAIRSFDSELRANDRRYGRTVIPAEVYAAEYLGNMPLNLFPGLEARREDGRMVVGHEATLAESAGAGWVDYPFVANLQPTWVIDGRHVLTDKSNWGMVNNNMIQSRYLAASVAEALSPQRWTELSAIVLDVPDRLHRPIEGGHMFFVGEDGARETVSMTSELLASARELAELLRSLT